MCASSSESESGGPRYCRSRNAAESEYWEDSSWRKQHDHQAHGDACPGSADDGGDFQSVDRRSAIADATASPLNASGAFHRRKLTPDRKISSAILRGFC
jgi:hypothetical protein